MKKISLLALTLGLSINANAMLPNAQSIIDIDGGKVTVSIETEPSTIIYFENISLVSKGAISSPDFPLPKAHRFLSEDIIGYRGGIKIPVHVFHVKDENVEIKVSYKSCDLLKEVCFMPKTDTLNIPSYRFDTHVTTEAPDEVFEISSVSSLRSDVNMRAGKGRNPYLALVEKGCISCKIALKEALNILSPKGRDLYVFNDAFEITNPGFLADMAKAEGVILFTLNNDAAVLSGEGGMRDKRAIINYFERS